MTKDERYVRVEYIYDDHTGIHYIRDLTTLTSDEAEDILSSENYTVFQPKHPISWNKLVARRKEYGR